MVECGKALAGALFVNWDDENALLVSAAPDRPQPLRSLLTHLATGNALPTDDQRLHVRIPCRRPIHVLNRHDVVLQSRILKAQEVADARGADGDGFKKVGVAFRYEEWIV